VVNQQYDRSSKEARIARANAGEYFQKLRNAKGYTQRDISEILGLKYYTFISQVENGQGRLPPYLWVKAAKALDVNVKEFALCMLHYYDPHAWAAITTEDELKDGTTDV
jgi:transcriptional regulator with XRE-family HTH domain